MSAELSDMRILLFARTMSMGGTEKVVLQLCRALKDKVAFVGVMSCGGELVSRLDDMGVPHFDVPDITGKDPVTISKVSRRLKKVVRENNVNLVHCHHRMAALYCQISLPKTLCIVATAHNVFQGNRCATRLLYHGMQVAACGGRVEDNLVSYFGIPRSHVKLIPNSVPCYSDGVIPIPEVASLPADVFKIGFVGRLTEAKGVRYLIDAVGILTAKGYSIRCFIVGDGELDDELHDLASKSIARDSFVFLGKRNDAQNFLSQMDVCVIPSLWEGLPLVLLEAFSVGVPVVASACDGVLDVIRDGDNGLLAEPADADSLSQTIERVFFDLPLRRKLGRNALSDFLTSYSYDVWVDRYLDFYKAAFR